MIYILQKKKKKEVDNKIAEICDTEVYDICDTEDVSMSKFSMDREVLVEMAQAAEVSERYSVAKFLLYCYFLPSHLSSAIIVLTIC